MNEDNQQPNMDPNIEARLVALILGEASDFEREELERMMAEQPELSAFYDEIMQTHDLMTEIGHDDVAPQGDWKLPAARREVVVQTFSGEVHVTAKEGNTTSKGKRIFRPRRITWIVSSLAAVLCLVAVLWNLVGTDNAPVGGNFARIAQSNTATVPETSSGAIIRQFRSVPSVEQVEERYAQKNFSVNLKKNRTDYKSSSQAALGAIRNSVRFAEQQSANDGLELSDKSDSMLFDKPAQVGKTIEPNFTWEGKGVELREAEGLLAAPEAENAPFGGVATGSRFRAAQQQGQQQAQNRGLAAGQQISGAATTGERLFGSNNSDGEAPDGSLPRGSSAVDGRLNQLANQDFVAPRRSRSYYFVDPGLEPSGTSADAPSLPQPAAPLIAGTPIIAGLQTEDSGVAAKDAATTWDSKANRKGYIAAGDTDGDDSRISGEEQVEFDDYGGGMEADDSLNMMGGTGGMDGGSMGGMGGMGGGMMGSMGNGGFASGGMGGGGGYGGYAGGYSADENANGAADGEHGYGGYAVDQSGNGNQEGAQELGRYDRPTWRRYGRANASGSKADGNGDSQSRWEKAASSKEFSRDFAAVAESDEYFESTPSADTPARPKQSQFYGFSYQRQRGGEVPEELEELQKELADSAAELPQIAVQSVESRAVVDAVQDPFAALQSAAELEDKLKSRTLMSDGQASESKGRAEIASNNRNAVADSTVSQSLGNTTEWMLQEAQTQNKWMDSNLTRHKNLGDNTDLSLMFGVTNGARENAEKLVFGNATLEGIRLATPSSRVKKFAAVAGLNEKTASDEAFSTFSLHVGDVSFKLAKAALARGEWPDASRIRIEEFVNAFDYGDSLPQGDQKVACALEQAIHPFVQQRNLLRVSMCTAASGRASNTPLRLTFLLDNSGSMERMDRQQIVRKAFALLAEQLKPFDTVTLISFARQPRLMAERVSGTDAKQLVNLIDNLPSEGGTNIEAALQLAFEKAKEQSVDGAQNRIVLLTDGAVNLGNANPTSLSRMITVMRNEGIAFDAAGIGTEGLNDEILEALTRKGDGRYYLLDSVASADEAFVKQIAGALRPSAKNVKVQVEFNPDRVGRYKLLGFEKHLLKKEDFRNDAVDAAEMAAAEAGVAVYQFEVKPEGVGDVGWVSVRFRDLSAGRMVESRWPIPYEPEAPRPDQASASLQIATSAAMLAAKLRSEPLGDTVSLKALGQLIDQLPPSSRGTARVNDLRQMIQQARQISGEQ